MKKIISIFISCLLLFNFTMQVSAAPVNEIARTQNRPKVSIIVPVYKVEPWLRECMDSLVNQTLKDIEIICIDDGSPDNCGKILDEYAEKDNRVKVIHQENKGVSVARNAGLDIATGEYITFVDSDDYVELNTYEIAYKYAEEDDVDVLGFKFRRFRDGKDSHVNNLNLSDVPVINLSDYIKNNFEFNVWNKIYKYEVIKKDNLKFLPQIDLGEDACFLYEVLGRAHSIKLLPAKFYNYRSRINSAVKKLHDSDKSKACAILKQVCSSWKNSGCIKNNEENLITLIAKIVNAWFKRENLSNYAQKILDFLGTDVYNPETVKKCPKRIQEILKRLELATSKKIENKSKLREIKK